MTTKTKLKTGKTLRFKPDSEERWAVVTSGGNFLMPCPTREMARLCKGAGQRIARVKSITVEITK